MVQVHFTGNLRRHVDCPSMKVGGGTLIEVLNGVFDALPQARGYVVDGHGALRRHMNIFINSERVADRASLTDTVPDGSDVYIMQALSGG